MRGSASGRARASRKGSSGCVEITFCARSAIVGSASAVRTVSNSARSSGVSVVPEKTASFCSGVARPVRTLSRRSALMGLSRRRLRQSSRLCAVFMQLGGNLWGEMNGGKDRRRDNHYSQKNYQCDCRPPPALLERSVGDNSGFRAAFGFQCIFRYKCVFVQAQEARNRAYKATIENSARQLIPLFVLQRHQETRSNARGGGNFFQGDAAHFPLAF